MGNRWMGLVAPVVEIQRASVVDEVLPQTAPVLRGVHDPQRGISALSKDNRLERFLTPYRGPCWLGVHGGAGETVLAELLGGMACQHRWPLRPANEDEETPAVVFLVARQNKRGLDAASHAARDWASGAHPDVELQGLVLVADAPGKTPRSLAGQTRVVSGGVPRTWVVPWIEELRLTGAVDWESLAREPRKVLTVLGEAVDEISFERTSR